MCVCKLHVCVVCACLCVCICVCTCVYMHVSELDRCSNIHTYILGGLYYTASTAIHPKMLNGSYIMMIVMCT